MYFFNLNPLSLLYPGPYGNGFATHVGYNDISSHTVLVYSFTIKIQSIFWKLSSSSSYGVLILGDFGHLGQVPTLTTYLGTLHGYMQRGNDLIIVLSSPILSYSQSSTQLFCHQDSYCGDKLHLSLRHTKLLYCTVLVAFVFYLEDL